MSQDPGDLGLETHRDWLAGWIARAASPALLRLESAEDLVQGVLVEAVRGAESAQWSSRGVQRAWLAAIARHHLTSRRRYWFALKRGSICVLRGGPGGEDPSFSPLDTATGPSTFAARREQVELLARALAVLLPIDRDLLVMTSEGHALTEVARRTGLTYENAQRRRLRAVARLRRAFEILAGRLD